MDRQTIALTPTGGRERWGSVEERSFQVGDPRAARGGVGAVRASVVPVGPGDAARFGVLADEAHPAFARIGIGDVDRREFAQVHGALFLRHEAVHRREDVFDRLRAAGILRGRQLVVALEPLVHPRYRLRPGYGCYGWAGRAWEDQARGLILGRHPVRALMREQDGFVHV